MKKKFLLLFSAALITALFLSSCTNNAIEPKTFIVKFDSKGGTKVEDQKVEEGNKVKVPEEPTKEGYIFVGWIENGDTMFNFDETIIKSDITLEAIWNPISGRHIVTFDSDGGSAVEPEVVIDGNKVDIPESPTRDGYEFRGWYKSDGSLFSFQDETITSNITLKARWSNGTKYFTVFFNTDGGSEIQSEKIAKGEKAIRPSDPTKADYVFGGWYKEGFESFDFDTETITDDITLYAEWNDPNYVVTTYCIIKFDAIGGSDVKPIEVEKGKKATEPNKPVKSNYKFIGWIDKDNKLFNFESEIITSDISLTAVWKEDSGNCTVKFDSNNGSAFSYQNVAKWSKIKKPADPKKDGEYFAYWAKNDNSIFNFDVETVAEDITLKAIWSSTEYFTVSFNTDGGSYIESQRIKKGDNVTKPKTPPTKEGYAFAGWVDDLTREYDFNQSVESNKTITAKWTQRGYEVKFVSNGTADDVIERIIAGGKAYKPMNPANEEKYQTFAYWTQDESTKTEFDFNTPIKSNITLYGVYRDLKVGDKGKAGGYIFYDVDEDNDKGNNDNLKSSECGWRYLEAAKADLASNPWGCYAYEDYKTGTAIGKGKQNTEALLPNRNRMFTSISDEVWQKDLYGYKDWFIPSKDEQNLMYENLHKQGLGNFKNDKYWTSSEYYDTAGNHAYDTAYFQNFANGEQGPFRRYEYFYIRPIRQF